MNRKTNIFYATGNDSKFLTFDNYSEALTGDILATDQKLWPSRFLCLYIDALNGSNEEERNNAKEDFINNYLTPYYENKLAFLRDNIEDTNELINISPLKDLLNLLYFYSGNKSGKSYTNITECERELFNGTYFDEISEDSIKLCYVSDIVEQDYNGTYADIICTITTGQKYKPRIKYVNLEGQTFDEYYNYKEYNNSSSKLYGWENENNQKVKPYIERTILFDNKIDNKNIYYTNSLIDSIQIDKYEDGNLKFNVLIPLFDSEYINKIEEYIKENNNGLIINGQINVPLGIYFTGKPVELESSNGIFNTNWSLLISMQFKAFPYSFDITHNFDDSDHIKEAYVTFAEILAKQNNSFDTIIKCNNQIIKLQQKISNLESIINNISTTKNVDDINLKITKIENSLDKKITSLESEITELNELIEKNKLRWQVKNT